MGPMKRKGPHTGAHPPPTVCRDARVESVHTHHRTKGQGRAKRRSSLDPLGCDAGRTLRVPGHLLVDKLGLLLRSSFILPTFKTIRPLSLLIGRIFC